MLLIIAVAFAVGGATIFGSLIGYFTKNIPERLYGTAMAFAAGVMLSAAVSGLIMPSLESGGPYAFPVTAAGVFAGALCIDALDKCVPYMRRILGAGTETSAVDAERLNSVLLFVAAIAIHNLPEGIAAGVGFGTGDTGTAIAIAGGIALQNIPEGMITITPMIAADIKRGRAFACAAATGIIEITGTLLGYFAATASKAVLPFALAFAGGTMLRVICCEMIPEMHADKNDRAASYALLAGFCFMMAAEHYM